MLKKIAIIGNISVPVTDSKEDLKQKSIIQDLKTIKYIISKVKLNKDNEKVSVLLDSGGKANFIFWAYTTQLLFKILNTL